MKRIQDSRRGSCLGGYSVPLWSCVHKGRLRQVSQMLHLGTMRRSLSSDESETPAERTYTDRYGNTRTMNTAAIVCDHAGQSRYRGGPPSKTRGHGPGMLRQSITGIEHPDRTATRQGQATTGWT